MSGAGAASGGAEGAGAGAGFLPKKSSPTSAFSHSIAVRGRVDVAGGWTLSTSAAGAGDGAAGGFFLKKLNMEKAKERKGPRAGAGDGKGRTGSDCRA